MLFRSNLVITLDIKRSGVEDNYWSAETPVYDDLVFRQMNITTYLQSGDIITSFSIGVRASSIIKAFMNIGRLSFNKNMAQPFVPTTNTDSLKGIII